MTKSIPITQFKLWEKIRQKRKLLFFSLEVTARCNNNCRHCYINLPSHDPKARKDELTLEEINNIADEAVSMGAVWCLLTGGEPLLRKDFFEIYLMLKKKGLLVSVFTNANLLTEKHIELFKKYPPRNMEVSVYGTTQETYEKITRVPGSFEKFLRGVELIKKSGLKARFKATVMKSNLHELDQIAQFCRKYTKDYYRFDPLLHLRFDQNPERNKEILSERLSPQ
jgi:MoaA/NifB/PqqE/SkfB family radical SAM enzyme